MAPNRKVGTQRAGRQSTRVPRRDAIVLPRSRNQLMGNGDARPRRALEGVRIIDLTWLQVGPQATRLLASFGAQVIRVEWRKRGAIDFLRYFQPFAPNHATPDGGRVQGTAPSQGVRGNYDRGAYFNNTNPGKYGV